PPQPPWSAQTRTGLEVSGAAETAWNLTEIWQVPVAQRGSRQIRRGRPRPAPEHAVRAEPRLRIALVGIGPETGVRLEPARGPLPHAGGRNSRRLQLVLGRQPRAPPARVRGRIVPGHAR